MTSLQAFDRENVNMVIHVPDYKLRRQIALQQQEAVVVEAFTALDETFYLHLRWSTSSTYPDVSLSTFGSTNHKMVLDVNVQSPHFTCLAGESASQWAPCSWSSQAAPTEVQVSGTDVMLQIDVPPSCHNDTTVTLEEKVTFTLVGTVWRLDDMPMDSLQCKSYRTRAQDQDSEPILTRMVGDIAMMKGAPDVATDVTIVLDEEGSAGAAVHAFVLQAHSPVFRRMLAGSEWAEAKERAIKMSGVAPSELSDFVSSLYELGIPRDVQEDESRLLGLLALADRYEVIVLRDECALVLARRLNDSNMAALLRVADLHHAEALRQAVMRFITCRPDRIALAMDTDDMDLRRTVREHLLAAEASRKARAQVAVCGISGL